MFNSGFAEDITGFKVKAIRLPVRSRNPKVIIDRLKPVRYMHDNNVYNIWAVCRDIKCGICIVKGIYGVEINMVKVNDRLSGLKHSVPLVRGIVDGKVVWSTRWDGESLVVDSLKCDVMLDSSMRLICNNSSTKIDCNNIKCVIENLERICGLV